MCVNVKSFCLVDLHLISPRRLSLDWPWASRFGQPSIASTSHALCVFGWVSYELAVCVDSGLALAKRIAFSGWIVSIIVTGVFKINRVDDCFRIKTK